MKEAYDFSPTSPYQGACRESSPSALDDGHTEVEPAPVETSLIRAAAGTANAGYTAGGRAMSDLATLQTTARAYLSNVPRSTRREEGQVYTPSNLVDFILDLGEYLPDKALEERRILDPACGAGAFLVAVVGRLASRLQTQGHDPRTAAGRRRFLETIERTVWGVDKDAHACGLAREAVRLQARGVCGRDAPAGFFDANVVEGDFLLGRFGWQDWAVAGDAAIDRKADAEEAPLSANLHLLGMTGLTA